MKFRVPKKYEDRYYSLELTDDLIDNCKYVLYFMGKWSYDGYSSVPVKSKKEALEFIRNATYDY